MTKHMAMESTSIWTGQRIKDNGEKTNSMGREWKRGQMELYTKESTKMAESTGRDSSSGPMDHSTRGNLGTIT